MCQPIRSLYLPEVVGVSPESDLELSQELVHPTQQWLGRVGQCLHRGLTLKHDDSVCQVCCHDEVVLHHKT